jgi:hypothetical protein
MKRVLIVLLALAAPALADAQPTGFADLPWGTPSYKVYEAMHASKICVFVRDEPDRATCSNYDMPGVGRGAVYFLSLLPEPGQPRYEGKLAGYYIVFRPADASYPAFRQVVVEKFGGPHDRVDAAATGEVLRWSWPGVMATLTQRCSRFGEHCLMVTTPALDAQTASQRAAERERAKKAF